MHNSAASAMNGLDSRSPGYYRDTRAGPLSIRLSRRAGARLRDRFVLAALISRGAMGEVFRATDIQTGAQVAVKVIARNLTVDPGRVERVKREGEVLRQLRHPNIVGFIDTFPQGDDQVIVTEFVPGGNLHAIIKQGLLPVERSRQITLNLCDALIRAHRAGIVHRDIKPDNVLLAADGTPRLTDVGVARLAEGTLLTRTGVQVGTPFYVAPEAWEGGHLDAQADIWSLGVVLYEILAGEVPFGGDTLVAVMNKVLTAPLPALRVIRREVSPGLCDVVVLMLARHKAVR